MGRALRKGDLAKLFEAAAESGLPIMVVGNAHCIQIHTGPVCNLKWLDDWFNVLDPEFNLHLKTTGIAELWRVRKPSTDGIVTSWEAFDADGELIVQLFGARKPGEPATTGANWPNPSRRSEERSCVSIDYSTGWRWASCSAPAWPRPPSCRNAG